MSNHFFTDEEQENFIKQMAHLYEHFKAVHGWNLTTQMENSWKEGVSDVFDAIVYASRRLTYDASSLRSELEFIFDNIDNKEQ